MLPEDSVYLKLKYNPHLTVDAKTSHITLHCETIPTGFLIWAGIIEAGVIPGTYQEKTGISAQIQKNTEVFFADFMEKLLEYDRRIATDT